MADPVECALGVVEDLFVGEAQDRETCGAKQGVADRIASSDAGVVVMAAIHLYDEPSSFAEEVDDEAAQRLLASELGVLELSASGEGAGG